MTGFLVQRTGSNQMGWPIEASADIERLPVHACHLTNDRLDSLELCLYRRLQVRRILLITNRDGLVANTHLAHHVPSPDSHGICAVSPLS
jgi:hypothetical protein